MSFKISWKFHIICFLIAILYCLVGYRYIQNIFIKLLINHRLINITKYELLNLIITVYLIFIPISILHELIHSIIYILFGGKIRYGFKGIYAYTKEISGIALLRDKFLAVLLGPVIVISIISLLFKNEIGKIIFFLNFLGSTGDIAMSIYILKINKHSYIIDQNKGFNIVDENTYKKSVNRF